MNRDEAKELIVDGYGISGLGEAVDKIYDDFESRICENCEHSEYHYQQDILECHKLYEEMNQRCYKCETDITIFEVVKTFGCNKFERTTP